jgi:epoxide hydrolase-like predicted phosphatase
MKNTLKGIRTIVFDFGGVVLNIDFELSYKAFRELGFGDIASAFSKGSQAGLFDLFETGRISAADFRLGLKALAGLSISDEELDRAWNAMLLDIPSERIRLVENLKKNFRVLLLSNTNEIHYLHYARELTRVYGYPDFSSLFHCAFFSFSCGVKKPDPAIYQMVVESEGVSPGEILFIDDSPQNLPPAESLGIKTVWLKPGVDVLDLFSGL